MDGCECSDVNREAIVDLDLVLAGSHSNQDLHVFFYHQNAISAGKLHKRYETSRPINFCPPHHTFRYSVCSPVHGPRVFSRVCTPNARDGDLQNIISWGQCHENAICIDAKTTVDVYGEGYRYSMAYCVDQRNFIELAQLMAGKEATGDPAGKKLKVAAEAGSSFQAVLTTNDSANSLRAKHLELQARKTVRVGDLPISRDLRLEDQECNECSRAGLSNLPMGTEEVQLGLRLDPGMLSGNLYLGSMERSLMTLP